MSETGVTSALGRPFGPPDQRVEVAELLWMGACGERRQQQQQQQHQQQQQQQRCVCEGEDNQPGFDYEGATFSLVGLLIFESGLGLILMFFPKSRTCIFAGLELVRNIRINSPTPTSAPATAPVAPVRAAGN